MDLRHDLIEPRLQESGIGVCWEECPATAVCNYCKFDYYCYPHLYRVFLSIKELTDAYDKFDVRSPIITLLQLKKILAKINEQLGFNSEKE